ncbi:Uncharacterised protein [Yersinia frederiksenii]|uniref:hypothetical protein n=1 Tax=Yersinia frederiksenii TaxID=29484 RepID=UPI0005E0FD58|nr:hypothetical protein [Yersinia frederiksenii]CFR07691.1 Uncharacterised protein [Yersinia frederiksenii]CNF97145.1 Uncharacterised protein [Yersinia frederiksenii]
MISGRIGYQEIRMSLLELYYIYCQQKFGSIGSNSSDMDTWLKDESEIGYAYEEFCESYDLPIENIMLEVLSLILRAGRGPEKAEQYHYNRIAEILSKHSLDDLMTDIDEEERKDLLYDMKLLKLI